MPVSPECESCPSIDQSVKVANNTLIHPDFKAPALKEIADFKSCGVGIQIDPNSSEIKCGRGVVTVTANS